ncbi:HAD family hydrolase [Dickeya lacustris]|uniref:HAD-IB family hydrolase n=1 Tax=Dickeya lacustris TaxID=2259638 RepID=A0ABY8G5Q3_9GAMM|nr:HAD family hydrolase [Dickeya lacustris]WFN55280.1 HAD-IB family hydrolase [Dickeya lacustris]
MELALFDLDETLISADSTGLWLRWLVSKGRANESLLQQEQQLMQRYYQGTLAIEEYMQLSLSPLTGLPIDVVNAWAEVFITQEILPRYYPQAQERLAWHRQRGDTVVVISASGEHLVAPIARRLGADDALAIGVTLDGGMITGQIHGTPTYQEGKVARLRQWCAQRTGKPFTRLHGYSDSLNDRAMLAWVDEAYVINPAPELAALATSQHWHICRWQH